MQQHDGRPVTRPFVDVVHSQRFGASGHYVGVVRRERIARQVREAGFRGSQYIHSVIDVSVRHVDMVGFIR